MRVAIDEVALQSNASHLKHLAPSMIPVLKGKFYGHGFECFKAIRHLFNLVAVHSLEEATALRKIFLGRILILGGVTGAQVPPGCIPVLNEQQMANCPSEFAIFASDGCQRLNVRPQYLTDELRSRLTHVLLHSTDYRRPYATDDLFRLSEAYGVSYRTFSVGSSTNCLAGDDYQPRVGMALTGYRSDGVSDEALRPVKSVFANLVDVIKSPTFGYNATYQDPSRPYVYSLDLGYYDNLYDGSVVTPVACDVPNASVVLLTGVRGAISMNHSFIASSCPLPPDTLIEVLGPRVRADSLARLHSTTTANILRIGNV